jgi:adenylate cyclase
MRCGACRFDNPPGFKFCGECGARLLAALDDGETGSPARSVAERSEEPAGERRKVTILFADLKDNTRLAERLEVEDVYHLLNDCLRGLADVIFKHEGYVDKFMGDGIMALFGAPVAHGDDPQRALRAALEMQEWVREYGRGIEARWGAPLRMRIGLNYGTVIAGRVGTDLKMEYDVIGDAVNVAKRMEEVAEPDTVCVSETLFRLTERWFEFVPLGALAVKGKRQPQAVYRLVGPRAGAPAGSRAAAEGPIVGRARELELLKGCSSSS